MHLCNRLAADSAPINLRSRGGSHIQSAAGAIHKAYPGQDSSQVRRQFFAIPFFHTKLLLRRARRLGMQQNGMPLFVTLTDSIFRLKRSDHDNQTQLAESREIKTVDHKPSKDAQILKGPAIFSGAFSNATAIVTFDEKACYTYHLTTSLSDHRYVIEYATKAAKDRDKHCLMQESSTGRAFIDPLTMQIERIECRTPNHPLPGTRALWTWSIDYGKVLLNGKTFWLPKKITAEVAGYSTPVEWSFDATYRNYHELTVTSRIVP
jgi:hypothetical protein